MNPSFGHHVAQLSAPPLGHVPPPPPLGHVPPPAPRLPPPAGHHPHPSPPRPGRVPTEVSPVVTVGVAPVLPQVDESPTRPVLSHGTSASEDSDSAKPKEGSEVMTVNQPTAQPHTKTSTIIPTSPATGPSARGGGEPVSTSKGTEEQKKPVKISFSGRKRLSSGGDGGPLAGPPAETSSAKLHVASQQNEPALKKQKSERGVPRAVAKAFADESDEEEEEMPREARLRMRNLGKDTPTSCGPNSFNKTSKGFIDVRGVWRKSN